MLENLLSCGFNREYVSHSKLVSHLLVFLTFYVDTSTKILRLENAITNVDITSCLFNNICCSPIFSNLLL